MDSRSSCQPRLIVVDDEADLRDMVAEYMQRENWSVRTAGCGKSLDILLAREDADLIVLDINMPSEDGLSVLRRIRDISTTPVVMLTAASNIADKIAGLDMGADDYMTKPFDLRELKTRIKAVLRRRPPVSGAVPRDDRATQTIKHILPFGKLFVDLNARSLLDQDGTSEPVTAMEFDLLQVFLQNPDRVLTRDRLLDLAHNRDNDPFDRSIDVRIARIRKKIEHNPAKPQALKTVRGAGYIFTPPRRTA